MSDKCPACGGPVERLEYSGYRGEGWIPRQPDNVIVRALPDTLEGIEAEGKSRYSEEVAGLWGGDERELRALRERDSYKEVLYRLFNGCVACNRKPLI